MKFRCFISFVGSFFSVSQQIWKLNWSQVIFSLLVHKHMSLIYSTVPKELLLSFILYPFIVYLTKPITKWRNSKDGKKFRPHAYECFTSVFVERNRKFYEEKVFDTQHNGLSTFENICCNISKLLVGRHRCIVLKEKWLFFFYIEHVTY